MNDEPWQVGVDAELPINEGIGDGKPYQPDPRPF